MARDDFIRLRVSEEEREVFQAVADAMGLTLSDMMRELVYNSAKRRGLPIPEPA